MPSLALHTMPMRLSRLLAPLLAVTLAGPLTACLGSDSTAPITSLATVETTTFATSLGVDIKDAAWTHTPEGLYYRTLTPGTDTTTATNGKRANVRYTGWLSSGQQFESSTYAFTLGTGQVIAGWDLGIVGMKVGEKRRLLIPAALAYGPYAVGPIPSNAVLVFDVELLSVT